MIHISHGPYRHFNVNRNDFSGLCRDVFHSSQAEAFKVFTSNNIYKKNNVLVCL